MLLKVRNTLAKVKTAVVLTAALLSVLFFTLRKFMQDPDFFWHLRTGQWILQHGQVPKVDVFSWYGVGKNLLWVAHEWLSDVLLYLASVKIGFAGLDILFAFFLFLLLWLCVEYTDIRLRRFHPTLGDTTRGVVLALCLMLSYLVLFPFVAVRPQLVSLILIVACAILFEKGKDWWTVPLILLGVNLHGGFWPLYFAVAAFYLLPRRKLWLLGAIGLLPFLTPNFQWTFLYPFYGMLDKSMTAYILEWQPAKLFVAGPSLFLSLSILLMLLLPKKKMGPWSALAIILVTVEAMRSIRFAILLPVFLIPIFVAFVDYDRITAILAGISNHRVARSYQRWRDTTLRLGTSSETLVAWDRKLLEGISISLIAVLLGGTIFAIYINRDSSNANLVQNSDFPVGAVAYLKQHPDAASNLLNEYGIGGYLLYNDIPTFVDGRTDPFLKNFNPGTNIFDEYFKSFYSLSTSPSQTIKKYGIRNVLWLKGTALYTYVLDEPSHFSIIYQDSYYFLARVN
jgi:hypothetical protein